MILLPVARRLITPPAVEPLTLAFTKKHLKIVHALDDDLINLWIPAARRKAEELTGEQFITQSWEFTFSRFPAKTEDSLQLPLSPLRTVDSIIYLDTLGVSQTFGTLSGSPLTPEEYSVIFDDGRPQVVLKLNKTWPITAKVQNAVIVKATFGYGASDTDIPALYKAGMLLLCGHFSENRETVVVGEGGLTAIEIPQGIRDLLLNPKAG